jgi:hypothetical protein
VKEGGVVTEFKIRKQITEDADEKGSSDTVYILCLDESGSMRGRPFEYLREAYKSFLAGLEDNTGSLKRVTVINFDDQARFISGPEPVPIADAPKDLPFRGSSTNFYNPMLLVGQVMSLPSCANSNFNVLFMTDGDGQGPGNLVVDYTAKYGPRYVQNVVGLGYNVNATLMQTLTAGGGTYRHAQTGSDLIHIFDSIAVDSKLAASPVWLWFEKKGTPEQLWKYTAEGCLENQLNHQVLDAEYANLITRPKNSGKDQEWVFTKEGYVISSSRFLLPLDPPKKEKETEVSSDVAKDPNPPPTVSQKPLVTLNNSEKEELQKQLQEIEVQITSSDKTVHTMLILEAVSCLSSMLVNHKKEAISAVGMTIKGAFKSVMMRKLDQDLLNGVCKCISAGFEVYKHYSAEKQFTMIQQVKCPRQLSDPIWMTYEQLVITSQSMEAVDGNWLLSANYISHLWKSAQLAIRTFPQNQQQSLRMLTACIQGDGCVVGINKLLRKATKNRTPSRSHVGNILTSTILDGESLTDTLRQVMMEAMGEMLESVEKIALQEAYECLDLLRKPLIQTFQEQGHLATISKEVLSTLRYITNSLKSFQTWKECFEKSIQKVLKHIKGILKLLETMLHYVNIFHITITPKEVEERITEIFANCHFNSLSFVPTLKILLYPPRGRGGGGGRGGGESSSSSKLPDPIKDEIDQVIVMINLLKRIFIESEKSLKYLITIFTKFSFTIQQNDLENYIKYKEKEQSSSIVSRTSNFFTKKPINPLSHLQSLLMSLPEYIQTTLTAQATLESKCSFFRFGIEIIYKVDDLFYLTSQIPLDQLKELQALRDHAEAYIENTLKGTVQMMMTDLKNIFDPVIFGTGWWTSISEVWGLCSFSDAMGALRHALPTLIGPGQFPERVEEISLITILELEIAIDSLWQCYSIGPSSSTAVATSPPSDSDSASSGQQQQQQISDELKRLIDGMRVTISQAKASSTNTNIQLLLSQELHREKVKYSLQETWQVIEDDVMLKNMEAFYSQESLRQITKKSRDHKELSQLTGFIDTVHHSIAENQSVERIAVAQEACQELMTGQSGVAGIGRSLMIQLSNLKRQMELSIDELTEMIIVADPRWGMEYRSGTPQSQDLAIGLSCQKFTRITPVYIPRSQYYTPNGSNTYNNYYFQTSGQQQQQQQQQQPPPQPQPQQPQQQPQGTCPVCGVERCPACGGTPSHPMPPHPPINPNPNLNPSPIPGHRPRRRRPASAGSSRSRSNLNRATEETGGGMYLPTNTLGGTSFGQANRFQTPQREVCPPSLPHLLPNSPLHRPPQLLKPDTTTAR